MLIKHNTFILCNNSLKIKKKNDLFMWDSIFSEQVTMNNTNLQNVMPLVGRYLWEPPTKRQKSSRGLVNEQPSSDVTVDWLPSYPTVQTQQ
jgi:hypothetical protein